MSTPTRNKLLIILAVLLIAGGGFLAFRGDRAGSPSDEAEEVQGDEMTVNGTIACLPYHVNISGQSCVKGVKGDDGKMYALNSRSGLESTMPEGTKVTAIGVFQPADTSVDDASVFKYDGVLVVRSLLRK